jgi:PAS domain S-box-containing protein
MEAVMTPAMPQHILVVDDNADDRAQLRSQLLRGSDQRWRFTEAATGAAALQALADSGPSSFDCVLLDYYLPDMDAQEVLTAMCQPHGQAPCPVLVVTAGQPQDGLRLMRAGAQDYIGKAWTTPESLARAVDNAMERFAMQQEGLRCQQALVQERERLALALTAGHMGVFELHLGDGSLHWSPEVYALLGVKPADFVPTRASLRMLVHPEDRSLPWQSLHELCSVGTAQAQGAPGDVGTAGPHSALHSQPSLPVTQEFRILRPDGQCRWMAQRGQTDIDAASGLLRHHGVIFDITERKRAEAEQARISQSLREQQFYTRSLIETNIDALVVTDAQGIVTDANRQLESLTACSRAELVGSPFTSLFCDAGQAQRKLDLTLNSQHLFDHELELCSRDGSQPVVSLNASTYHDRQRKLLGVIFSVRDVTQRHFLNRALQETNLSLEEARFLAIQDFQTRSAQTRQNNRELLTQLQAVLLCVEQLQAGPPPPSPVQAVSIALLLQDSRRLLAQIQATVAAPAAAAGLGAAATG